MRRVSCGATPISSIGCCSVVLSVVVVVRLLTVEARAQAVPVQEPSAPQAVSGEQLKAAIDKLGDLDYATRTNASRLVRRTPAAQAVPALLQAVAEHGDGYVRYRALVLLTGFNDPRTKDAMRESMASPNDRLRTVAYSFLEHNPDPAMVPAPDCARSRRNRPSSSVRRWSARSRRTGRILGCSRCSIRDVGRGEDFFRGAVIEALGDYKAQYAFDAITTIAKLDGPLQDDSAIALGRIGDKRALETLAGLQRTAPRPRQPAIAAAICLLGVNCDSHEPYLIETLKFGDKNPGFQELLRGGGERAWGRWRSADVPPPRRRCSISASRRAIRLGPRSLWRWPPWRCAIRR